MSQYPEQIYRHTTASALRNWRERHGRYRLVGTKCKDCGELHFPRRVVCPNCNQRNLEPYEHPHTGEIITCYISDNPWGALEKSLPGDVIPGIADQTVIVWGLGKSIGDTLVYTDEYGRKFNIKLVGGLANSIFQGNIIISEKVFIQKYPSISGSRIFLVEAPFTKIEDISQKISRALQDQGVDVIPTFDRLAQFSQIENTYLSIFLILGTFGLILGSIGIGIVIWRNVSERQGELALLRSVGFKRRDIQKLILSEHTVLVFAGIIIGIMTAVLASFPALMTPGTNIPYGTFILLLLIVVLNGGFWVYSATYTATKKDLLPALRNE